MTQKRERYFMKMINYQVLAKNWINILRKISVQIVSKLSRNNIQKFFLCFFLSLGISACTTAGNAISKGGPTMAQIYEQAMVKSDNGTLAGVRKKVQPLYLSENI